MTLHNRSKAFCVTLFISSTVYFQIDVPSDFHVVIVGAGVSGICMGKRLGELGIR